MIYRCQPGFETFLEKELRALALNPLEAGSGWVRTGPAPAGADWRDLCFAQVVMPDAVEISGDSVNALAARIMETFLASAKEERFGGEWPCLFESAAGLDGLGRRQAGVSKVFYENLKKRLGRVARLAVEDKPRGVQPVRGLFVFFVDFKRAYVSREIWSNGQRRMADDARAPSRSYLKVEEAYLVLGREPAEGETVVDLGAAPGGWSFSAAKRGAKVIAVDNGPLKLGALDNPLIEHRLEDAFRFEPPGGQPVDWMFCDLVEEPHHVMENLIQPWIERGWCRRFVVILKFGRVDALALLRQVRASDSVFSRHAPGFRVRHLYHDREEFTIVGEVAGAAAAPAAGIVRSAS